MERGVEGKGRSIPPAVTFQEDTPGKTDNTPPSADLTAEGIVQVPDQEPSEEHEQAVSDHEPHGLERLHIARILVVLLFHTGNREAFLLAREAVLLARVSPAWP